MIPIVVAIVVSVISFSSGVMITFAHMSRTRYEHWSRGYEAGQRVAKLQRLHGGRRDPHDPRLN